MSPSKICSVSNIAWIVISLIGVVGAWSHPTKDVLFLYRYILALLSSAISLVSIHVIKRRWMGWLAVVSFVPFIALQLAEFFIGLVCESTSDIVWGVDCGSLLIFPDNSKLIQVITDESAVLLLACLNLSLLWDCHVSNGHYLYDMSKPGRTSLSKPFLSTSSLASLNEYMSAEEGDNFEQVNQKVYHIGMSQPSLVNSLNELRPEEAKAVTELQAACAQDPSVNQYNLHDWLRLAWSRSLDPAKAVEVLKYHKDFIKKLSLREIPMDQVRENFKAGFSVVAGRDFDGRPMLWQRMQYMTPATIPLNVGIKSTWLALDAALADVESNRTGVCLIYDFTNVGMSNISLNLFDVRDGSLACGAGHPSHVSRVLFLNPPFVFKLGYNAAKPLLPTGLTNLVTMININDSNKDDWFQNVCPQSQLPEYLGGQQDGDYFTWLSTRLHGSNMLYHDPDLKAVGQ